MKGLDTNVLVRFLVKDDPEQEAAASAYIGQNCTPNSPCFINRIVICELVWVLDRGYGFSRPEIAEALRKVLAAEEFRIEDQSEVLSALELYSKEGVDFADSLIQSTNLKMSCEETASFDKKAARFGVFNLIESSGPSEECDEG